jgi:hypothetical protein
MNQEGIAHRVASRAPLVVTGNQYLLQAGHHAFPSYRTIVETGLMSIDEPFLPD